MLLFFYIVKEMLFPFFLTASIITSILLMDQIFRFIPFLQASGLELKSVYLMVIYSLPPILMITIPVSLLIGIYIGVARISSDYELVVIRAAGVSLSYLFKPVIFISVIVSMLVMLLTFYLSPYGISKLELLKFSILKKQAKIALSVNKINNFFNQKLIYIFEKDDEYLKGIFIADLENPEDHPLIEAQKGKIYMDEEKQVVLFHLINGKVHQQIGKKDYRIIEFDQLDYNLAPPQIDRKHLPVRYRKGDASKRAKKDTEWTMNELFDQINHMPETAEEYHDIVDEFHGRIVTILSCICFAVFALPMGIYDPRSPKTGNIIYMVIVIIVYYLLFTQARSMLLQGKAHPVTLYLPLLIALGLGAFNYLKINYNFTSFREYLKHRRKPS